MNSSPLYGGFFESLDGPSLPAALNLHPLGERVLMGFREAPEGSVLHEIEVIFPTDPGFQQALEANLLSS